MNSGSSNNGSNQDNIDIDPNLMSEQGIDIWMTQLHDMYRSHGPVNLTRDIINLQDNRTFLWDSQASDAVLTTIKEWYDYQLAQVSRGFRANPPVSPVIPVGRIVHKLESEFSTNVFRYKQANNLQSFQLLSLPISLYPFTMLAEYHSEIGPRDEGITRMGNHMKAMLRRWDRMHEKIERLETAQMDSGVVVQRLQDKLEAQKLLNQQIEDRMLTLQHNGEAEARRLQGEIATLQHDRAAEARHLQEQNRHLRDSLLSVYAHDNVRVQAIHRALVLSNGNAVTIPGTESAILDDGTVLPIQENGRSQHRQQTQPGLSLSFDATDGTVLRFPPPATASSSDSVGDDSGTMPCPSDGDGDDDGEDYGDGNGDDDGEDYGDGEGNGGGDDAERTANSGFLPGSPPSSRTRAQNKQTRKRPESGASASSSSSKASNKRRKK